jgi:type I restriction enzyme R subunit
MREAGYADSEAQAIKTEVDHYEKVREEVKLASGDYVDMKMYEPAMRHLLDTYIRAEESEKLSAFDDMTLIQIIVERGEEAVESLPEGIRKNQEAMAETIENNVRRLIIDEMAVNPKYYEKMSELLDALIRERKQQTMNYKAYLKRIIELTNKVRKPETGSIYPPDINSPARRALYDNLGSEPAEMVREHPEPYGQGGSVDIRAKAAIALDDAIRRVKKDDWRGSKPKQREVRIAIRSVLSDDSLVDKIFEIVKNQREY